MCMTVWFVLFCYLFSLLRWVRQVCWHEIGRFWLTALEPESLVVIRGKAYPSCAQVCGNFSAALSRFSCYMFIA